MKKIVSVLVIIMLLLTGFVLIDNDFNVEGTGGDGENNSSIGLDYLDYIWEQTLNFSNVIYEYPPDLIPKGRSFGSWGGNYAKDYINNSLFNLSLDDVHTEKIQHNPEYPLKNYTSIINVSDFRLTINNPYYTLPNPVPIKECFLINSGWTNLTENLLKYNKSFENAQIIHRGMFENDVFGGALTNCYTNITSYNYLNSYNITFGHLVYINSSESVPEPEEQYGKVFLFENIQETESKLENLTNAFGSILIDQQSKGVSSSTAEKTSCSVINISYTDGNYVKELLENDSVFVDDLCGNLTLTYNITGECIPTTDYFIIDRIPDHYELWEMNDKPISKWLSKFLNFTERRLGIHNISLPFFRALWWLKMAARWTLNEMIYNQGWPQCLGFIMYCSDDYHFMFDGKNRWDETEPAWDLYDKLRAQALQSFTLNYTVGNFLYEHRFITTVSGYANQSLLVETNNTTGLEAYNVLGNITIDHSPDDALAIISNRYDGWWGQTPGDSGVGGAILLGIAKYMKDYNIKPKYNLTFLFTTGEEYGFRGAHYYNDTHPENQVNIKYWFIMDQLAFDQNDTALCVYYKNDVHGKIINEIINQTQYKLRTGYEIIPRNDVGKGSEQFIASSRNNCDSFCFVKDQDYRWDRWHTTGNNYTTGDCIDNTDRNDVNVTAELVWNITKYFTIDPDCWIDNYSATTFDSTSDNDTKDDSVNITFSLKTILPNDKIRVKAELKKTLSINEIVDNCTVDYVINSNGINDSIILSVPENASTGFYTCRFYLYNSTGRINEILNIGSPYLRYNDSKQNVFYLHRSNENAVTPDFSNVGCSSQTIGYGSSNIISGCVSSPVNSTIIQSRLYVLYPDDTFEGYNMTKVEGDVYEILFNNTWENGEYLYCIWAIDENGNTSISDWYSFNSSIHASISIATLKDSYGPDEIIDITDPPNPAENYMLVDRGLTWNKYYDDISGSNVLEVYTSAVNYQEDNGTWSPINCSLEQLTTNHPAYNYGYRIGNEHGLYNVYFKPNSQDAWPVAFAYNKSNDPNIHVVRSKLVGVGYLDPASNWAYKYLQNVQSSQGQFTDNKITYENVFSGINVVWTYENTGLKENIILSNTTKALLQSHPPSDYGLGNNSYLVFITRLDYKNLIIYNESGILTGNVTVSDGWIGFKDILNYFKCALPIGEAYELYNESVRQKLVYRILQYNGNYYLLLGLKVQDLNNMVFPVVIDPTITVTISQSDGYIYKSSSNYETAWSAEEGTVSCEDSYISIGQSKVASFPPDYRIRRGFLFFDTSELPSNACIDNVVLSLYKKNDYSDTEFTITVQNGQPDYPHDPLEERDYNKEYYSGNGGELNTADLVNGYNNITLTELSLINIGGMTKLCLRSSRDINGTIPTGSEYVNVYSSNIEGEPYPDPRPKLIIIYRNQSKIKNTGSTNITGYLLIQVQYKEGEEWKVDHNTVDETFPRMILVGNQLALDTVFNGLLSTDDFRHGSGTYRVYAAFRDPDGDVLVCDDDSLLEASYEFTVNI